MTETKQTTQFRVFSLSIYSQDTEEKNGIRFQPLAFRTAWHWRILDLDYLPKFDGVDNLISIRGVMQFSYNDDGFTLTYDDGLTLKRTLTTGKEFEVDGNTIRATNNDGFRLELHGPSFLPVA
jgi:hypothetical protein